MAPTTGTIKRKTDKGFGFIAAGDGTEYFFHQSSCVGSRFDDLREGQRVSFTVGPGGPRKDMKIVACAEWQRWERRGRD
jgi:CspA family cold shock protein